MTIPRRPLPMDIAEGAGLRRWRNQTPERERDVPRTRALWRALLAIIVAIAPAGAYLMQQNECLKLSYAVGEIRAEQRELAEQERRLTGRHAHLESLQAIELWARENGLERPLPENVVVLVDPAPGGDRTEDAVALASARGLAGNVKVTAEH